MSEHKYIIPEEGDFLRKVYTSKFSMEKDMKEQEFNGWVSLSFVKNIDGTFSALYLKI